MLFYFACEAAGASAPGIPHALPGRKLTCTTRAHSRRENAKVSTCRIVRRQSDESHLSPSCPGLSRASTSLLVARKSVDGRDKPSHDDQLCWQGSKSNAKRVSNRERGTRAFGPHRASVGEAKRGSHLSLSCP